jgi:O-antigen ligase
MQGKLTFATPPGLPSAGIGAGRLRTSLSAARRAVRRTPGRRLFPSTTELCFYAIAAFCVLPLFDIPLLGLSFTAPLFLAIAFRIFTRPPKPWFPTYRIWVCLAGTIWMGLLLAFLVNAFSAADLNLVLKSSITLVRFAYWLLFFVGTAYFVSIGLDKQKLVAVLGFSVTILAGLRWFEGLAFGKIGAWSNTVFMTQNGYAFYFTAFSPFLLAIVAAANGLRMLYAILGMFIVSSAVAINGSRGSWVAIALGTLLFLLFCTLAKPRRAWLLWSALALLGILLMAGASSSERVRTAVFARFATMKSLEEDKSYMLRQYLNKKSWSAFRQSPLVGVGPGLYKDSVAEVELPDILEGANRDYSKTSSHNSYLALLAESGLAGSLPYCLLLVTLLARGSIGTLTLTRAGHTWALAAFVSFVSMSIQMWAMSTLTTTTVWFVYGLVAAVVVAAKQEMRLRHGTGTQSHCVARRSLVRRGWESS